MPLTFTRTAAVQVGVRNANQVVNEYRLDHDTADNTAGTTYTVAQLMNDVLPYVANKYGVVTDGVSQPQDLYVPSNALTNTYNEWGTTSFDAGTNTFNFRVDIDGWVNGVEQASDWNASGNATTIDHLVLHWQVTIGTTVRTFYCYGGVPTVVHNSANPGQPTFEVPLDNCFNVDGTAYTDGNSWTANEDTDLTSDDIASVLVFPAAFLVRQIDGDSAETTEWELKSATSRDNAFPTPSLINCNFRLTDNTIGHKRITVRTFDNSALTGGTQRPSTSIHATSRLNLFGGTTTQTGNGAANVTTASASAVNLGLVRFGGVVSSLEIHYTSRATFNDWDIQPYDYQNTRTAGGLNVAHGQRNYAILGGFPGTVTMPDEGCPVFKESYVDGIQVPGTDTANHRFRCARYDIDVLPRITGTATIGVYKPLTNPQWTSGGSFAHSGGALTLGSGTILTGMSTSDTNNAMELRPLLGDGTSANVTGRTIDPDLGTSLYVWPDSYWDIESKPERAPNPANADDAVFNTFYPDGADTQAIFNTRGDVYLIRNYPFNAYRSIRLGQDADANSLAIGSASTTPVILSNMTSSDPENFRHIPGTDGDNGLHIYTTFYTPRFEDQQGTRYTGGFVARRRLATQNLGEATPTIAGAPSVAGLFAAPDYTTSPRDWVNLDQEYYLYEYAPDDSKNGYQLTWGMRVPRYGSDGIGANLPGPTTLSSGGFDVWFGVPGTQTARRTKVPFDAANNSLDLQRTDVIVAGTEEYWNPLRQRSYYESFTGIIDGYPDLGRITTADASVYAASTTYSVGTIVYRSDQVDGTNLTVPYLVLTAFTTGTDITGSGNTLADRSGSGGSVRAMTHEYYNQASGTIPAETIRIRINPSSISVDPDAMYELVVFDGSGGEHVRAVVPTYAPSFRITPTTGNNATNTFVEFNVADAFVKSGAFTNIGNSAVEIIAYANATFEPSTRIEVHNTSTETGHTWSNELFRHYTTRGGSVASNAWESVDDFVGGIEFLPLKMAKTWSRRTDAQKTTEMSAWMGSTSYVERLSRVRDDRRIGFSPITFDQSADTAEINPTSEISISLGVPSDTATDRANVAEANIQPSLSFAGSQPPNDASLVTIGGSFEFLPGVTVYSSARLTTATLLAANDTSATVINPIVSALGTADQGRFFMYFDPEPAGVSITTWVYYAISGYQTNTGTTNIFNISLLASSGDVNSNFGATWAAAGSYGALELVQYDRRWYQNLSGSTIVANQGNPSVNNSWTRVVPKIQVTPINADETFTTPSGLNETITFDDLDIRFTSTQTDGLNGRIPNQSSNIRTLIANNGHFDLDRNILDCSHATNPHVQLRGDVIGLRTFTTTPSATDFSVRGWTEMDGDFIIENSATQTGDEIFVFSNCAVRPGGTVTLRLRNDPGTYDVRVAGLPDGVLLRTRDAGGGVTIKAPITENTITFNWNTPPSGGQARFSVIDSTGVERVGLDATTVSTTNLALATAEYINSNPTDTFYAVISGNGVVDAVASFDGQFEGIDTKTVNLNNAVTSVFPETSTPSGINFRLSETTTSANYNISGSVLTDSSNTYGSFAVSGITRETNAVITATAVPNTILVGDTLTVSGVTPAVYNTTYTITAINAARTSITTSRDSSGFGSDAVFTNAMAGKPPYAPLPGVPDRLITGATLTGSRFGFQYAAPANATDANSAYSADNKLVIGVEGASNGTSMNTVELINGAFGSTNTNFVQVLGSADYNRLLGYRAARGDTNFGFIRNIGNLHLEVDSRYVVFAPAEESTQNLGYITMPPAASTFQPTATRDRPTSGSNLPFRVFFTPVLPAGVSEQDIQEIVNRARNQIIANL